MQVLPLECVSFLVDNPSFLVFLAVRWVFGSGSYILRQFPVLFSSSPGCWSSWLCTFYELFARRLFPGFRSLSAISFLFRRRYFPPPTCCLGRHGEFGPLAAFSVSPPPPPSFGVERDSRLPGIERPRLAPPLGVSRPFVSGSAWGYELPVFRKSHGSSALPPSVCRFVLPESPRSLIGFFSNFGESFLSKHVGEAVNSALLVTIDAIPLHQKNVEPLSPFPARAKQAPPPVRSLSKHGEGLPLSFLFFSVPCFSFLMFGRRLPPRKPFLDFFFP